MDSPLLDHIFIIHYLLQFGVFLFIVDPLLFSNADITVAIIIRIVHHLISVASIITYTNIIKYPLFVQFINHLLSV